MKVKKYPNNVPAIMNMGNRAVTTGCAMENVKNNLNLKLLAIIIIDFNKQIYLLVVLFTAYLDCLEIGINKIKNNTRSRDLQIEISVFDK